MKNNETNNLLQDKKFFFTLFLFAFPIIATSENILIKDLNSSSEVSCNYESLTVSGSGKIELLLNDYQSCIATLPSELIKNCSFNGRNYSNGKTLIFYKSETDCSAPITATCDNDSFSPNPNNYTAITCNSNDSSLKWLADTLELGNNMTSEDLYGGTGSPEGREVYTLDGGRITAAPGCANNKGLGLCGKASDWLPGARTNQVYAIRNNKKLASENTIQFAPNVSGVNIQQSVYDVTISPNPGQMDTSSFTGDGCTTVNNNQRNFTITLVSDRNFEKYKDNLSSSSCYVPHGSDYYINIRATGEECDLVGQERKNALGQVVKDANGRAVILGPCNSYYEMH